jgi:hypothetical protein
MIVDPFVKSPQPLWREPTHQWLNPSSAPPAVASSNQSREDRDPAPPAMVPWPRIFPGL